jgi:hypothetical protein
LESCAAGKKLTNVEKSTLPMRFPFLASGIDTFIDSFGEFRPDATDALVGFRRLFREGLPGIV